MKEIDKFKIYSNDLEDLILYYILKNEDKIFYIDIGAGNPDYGSVTRTYYENGIGNGINIEPQRNLYHILCEKRDKDVNVHAVIGNANQEKVKFYLYNENNSSVSEKAALGGEEVEYDFVPMYTYQKLMEQLGVEEDISFLKIDVEGFEKEVVENGFGKWRPKIIICEYVPGADTKGYKGYEKILAENGYQYCMSYLSNRYYLASEAEYLHNRFVSVTQMLTEILHEFAEERVRNKIMAQQRISTGYYEDKLEKYKGRKIAIWGMGPLGIMLYESIKGQIGEEDIMALDLNADTFDPDVNITIIKPEDFFKNALYKEVDLVIKSFQGEGEEEKLLDCDVISIFDK